MKAPDHWWPEPGRPRGFGTLLKQALLFPASYVYGRAVLQRMALPGKPPVIPVVCIGNFVAGGAGKTPTALAVYDVLADLGLTPAFVTRGYGGALATSSFRVDAARHRSDEVGDEPLLLAQKGETFVGPDRLTSINSAAELGATCVLFDDGFQNPAIDKNLSIIVVDAAMGVGNGLTHPGGPLRAPLKGQMHHADMIVIIGKGEAAHPVVRLAARAGKPILAAELAMHIPEALRGKPLFAYSGIGHPIKFFSALKRQGLDVAKERGFADHHPYSQEDARELLGIARERGAMLVTTEKDAMRLRGRTGALGELREASTVIGADLTFEDPAYLKSLLGDAIRQWRRDMSLVEFD